MQCRVLAAARLGYKQTPGLAADQWWLVMQCQTSLPEAKKICHNFPGSAETKKNPHSLRYDINKSKIDKNNFTLGILLDIL